MRNQLLNSLEKSILRNLPLVNQDEKKVQITENWGKEDGLTYL